MNEKNKPLFAFVTALLAAFVFVFGACSKSDSTSPGGGAGSVITVVGKVIGQNLQPVPGVPVIIAGHTSVNTDGSGVFTISSVTTPYTVTVVDGTNKRAIVYRGLTRSDPTLVWFGVSVGTAKSATVSGGVTPWAATGASTKTSVAFTSPEAAKTGTAVPATGLYSIGGITWYGPSSTVGSIYALQWDFDASNLPTTFKKYGMRSGVTLVDGATTPNILDTVTATTSGSVAGSVTAASGYTIQSKIVDVIIGGSGDINIASESGNASSFSYVTPNIAGSTISIEAISAKAGVGQAVAIKSGIATTATGVALTIPAAPELSLPIAAATGVNTSTPFSWSPVTGAVHLIAFTAGGANPTFYVLTTAASDSIPNLSSLGLGLPAATNYTWSVIAVGPFASTDAATGSAGFLSGLTSLKADVFLGLTNSRAFTTAP